MGVNNTMLKMASGSDAGVMKTISTSLDYFPKTAGESIIDFFEKHNTKALFNTWGKVEGASAIFLDGNEITGVHELAHVLEKINPWVAELEKEFYNKRTAGEDFLYLKNILPMYRDDKKYKKDNFLHPYIGKYNDGKEWEIFSTGIQHIMFNIFNGHDNEYEAFIIGLLLRL